MDETVGQQNLAMPNAGDTGSVDVAFGLDAGFVGTGVRLGSSSMFGARPVKDDRGGLVGILFGPEWALDGDVEQLAEDVLRHQVTGSYGETDRKKTDALFFSWVDTPCVVPVARGLSISDINRKSGNYYRDMPKLSELQGFLFAGSSTVNWMIDNDVSLSESNASDYGLYIPIHDCPAVSRR